MFDNIDKHINECREALKSTDTISKKDTFNTMTRLYYKIKAINSLSQFPDMYDINWSINMIIESLEKYKEDRRYDLKMAELKSKNISFGDIGNIHDSGNSNNTNINTNKMTSDINVKAMIENAKKMIEEDDSLGEDEVNEIVGKLNEIEIINEEEPSPNKKWRRLKECMSWIGTKGSKVASIILPIILQLIEVKGE